MNVLVACEFSGMVREAFNHEGHNATSCDLLPSQQMGSHIQGDVLKEIEKHADCFYIVHKIYKKYYICRPVLSRTKYFS